MFQTAPARLVLIALGGAGGLPPIRSPQKQKAPPPTLHIYQEIYVAKTEIKSIGFFLQSWKYRTKYNIFAPPLKFLKDLPLKAQQISMYTSLKFLSRRLGLPAAPTLLRQGRKLKKATRGALSSALGSEGFDAGNNPKLRSIKQSKKLSNARFFLVLEGRPQT